MKIALLGYGRMGKEIEKMATSRGHEIVMRIDSSNAKSLQREDFSEVDMAIDFSTPESAFFNISLGIESGIPVVSGTTGWLSRFDEIKKRVTQRDGAFFYASNFSIGMNLFFELNQRLAQMMSSFPEYTISMEEIHHTGKKDAPSGTAITLAEGIIAHHKQYSKWALTDENERGQIPIRAYRKDPVPGTHIIEYDSPIDTLILKHEAKSRDGFVLGAILAAEFLFGKKGIYGMKDLLKH
jgi:4-hydroxy-tetrahydrodipicolinate reductase